MAELPLIRRKTVGKRLARARRAAGFRSQAAFATAIGVSEGSVARAESGSELVGAEVFTRIEIGLHLPAEVVTQYIETGEASLLAEISYDRAPSAPAESPDSALDEEASQRFAVIKNLFDSWDVPMTPQDATAIKKALLRKVESGLTTQSEQSGEDS